MNVEIGKQNFVILFGKYWGHAVSFMGIHKTEPDIYIGFLPSLHMQCTDRKQHRQQVPLWMQPDLDPDTHLSLTLTWDPSFTWPNRHPVLILTMAVNLTPMITLTQTLAPTLTPNLISALFRTPSEIFDPGLQADSAAPLKIKTNGIG
jgi:hypothetical protein